MIRLHSSLSPKVLVLQAVSVVIVPNATLLRLDIESLSNLARVCRRQRLFTAASGMIFVSLTSDGRHSSVAIWRSVAKRHCVERHAVAAGYFFWDIGTSGASCVDTAAHAALLKRHRD